jgi:hypothetical protein
VTAGFDRWRDSDAREPARFRARQVLSREDPQQACAVLAEGTPRAGAHRRFAGERHVHERLRAQTTDRQRRG